MRTPLLTSLILLSSATTALAQANEQPGAPAAPAPVAAPAAPAAVPAPAPSDKPVVVPVPVSPNTALPVAAPPPGDTGVPASIPTVAVPDMNVGLQRLPAVSYPDFPIRGIKYGSMWLTFHGLQWPYMGYIANGQKFVIGLSGWGWVDNSYQKFGPSTTDPMFTATNIKVWKAQSRMLLRVTPTYAIDREHFIQGQVELVGTGDQTIGREAVGGADTDDLWLRFGQWNKWDFTIGRFEGWEVFHLGMGLDFNTFERQGADAQANPQIAFYGLTDNQFRPGGQVGNAAIHVYPFPFLRFELLGMAGSFSGPVWATRPVGILDFGWVKFKAGVEYQKLIAANTSTDNTSRTSKGVGGALQFVLAPHIEFGVNAAQGTVLDVDRLGVLRPEGSITRTSIGAFANVSNGDPLHPFIIGVGSMMTWTEDQNGIEPNPIDSYWLYQGFVAAQYVVSDVMFIKLVGGYSKAHFEQAGNDPRVIFDNEMYSARLRFSFYF